MGTMACDALWQTGGMRRLIPVLLFASACAGPTSPAAGLNGTWSEDFAIRGASLVLTIDASGNGAGTYAIEAGRSGAVQVVGVAVAPQVVLSIRYDYGLTRRFIGSLSDANHLAGAFDDDAGTVVFTRTATRTTSLSVQREHDAG
jgi:hypothetical protein